MFNGINIRKEKFERKARFAMYIIFFVIAVGLVVALTDNLSKVTYDIGWRTGCYIDGRCVTVLNEGVQGVVSTEKVDERYYEYWDTIRFIEDLRK